MACQNIEFLNLGMGVRSKKLNDGSTVVPHNYKFKNIIYFEKSVYNDIDINYLYERKYSYRSDNNFNDIGGEISDVKRMIQFYPDGHIRLFSFNNVSPDPNQTGMRGIIYMRNNKIKIDEQFAYQGGGLYIGTVDVKIEDGKVYILYNHHRNSESKCDVYQKSEKIPEEWKKYKADW